MGEAVVQIVATVALVFVASAGADKVTCVLKEKCSLPCPFQGDIEKASWKRLDDPNNVPIVVYPPSGWHLHHEYRNISSLSLQPEGGAVLVIDGVQLKHQGLHRCSVTSRTGNDTDRFVDLRVHSPVLNVSLRQEGQQLFCRAKKVYPKPTVDWSPVSSDSDKPSTYINSTEDGLFTVSSSVTLPANSSDVSYACNISTAYSSKAETITPSSPDKTFLIHLLIPALIIAALTVAAITSLVCYCQKKPGSWERLTKLCKKTTSTSHEEEPGVRLSLNSPEPQPRENGHLERPSE